ncbi:MAG TPA: (2Fe-2S)-binding protein [Burkholderiales bacterium]|nr:(2Fe-2S)-binding protein [Burkholderiales bacterium]
MQIKFTLNGKPVAVDVPPQELLSELLRERMGLTGTHVGCDTSQCGACVVHVDGVSVKSCSTLAASLNSATVTSIEGLAPVDGLHPMQKAFHEHHGLQCGFCTPGMVMSAVDFAKDNPKPSPESVRNWLEGNICRCTGYQNIVASVIAGAAAMHANAKGA